MKTIFKLTLLLLVSCAGEDRNCSRLSCLPDIDVNTSHANTGKSVIEATGGIDGIVIYQFGTTIKAYDFHDPNKCTTEPNSKLKLSADERFLVSTDGEQYFLQNGQPTQGISCRSLIQYHARLNALLITITN